mgnify:CR=1 FL=1
MAEARKHLGLFQHTAARRRLVFYNSCGSEDCLVSTHSRPKAAGMATLACKLYTGVSTHSRPKAAGYQSFPK